MSRFIIPPLFSGTEFIIVAIGIIGAFTGINIQHRKRQVLREVQREKVREESLER